MKTRIGGAIMAMKLMMMMVVMLMVMDAVSPLPIPPIPSSGVRDLDLRDGSSAIVTTSMILKPPIKGLLKADLEEGEDDRQKIQHSPASILIPRSITDQNIESPQPPPAPTIPNAISSTASPTSTTKLSTEEATLTPSSTSQKKNAAIGLAIGAAIIIIVLTFGVRKWRADARQREMRRKETGPAGDVTGNVGAAPSYTNTHRDVGNGQAPMSVIVVVREGGVRGGGRPNVGEIRAGNRAGNRAGRVDDELPSYEEANRGR